MGGTVIVKRPVKVSVLRGRSSTRPRTRSTEQKKFKRPSWKLQ